MTDQAEYDALSADVLALRVVVTNVLNRVGAVDPEIARAIAMGFDDAAAFIEELTVKNFGTPAGGEYGLKLLRTIENLRRTTVGYEKKPD